MTGSAATLPIIRVVDARGTNVGWQLRAGVRGLPRSVQLGVRRIVAMAVSTCGLHASGDVAARHGHDVRLAGARRGTGAGSFDVTIEVEAVLPSTRGDQVTAGITFDVR